LKLKFNTMRHLFFSVFFIACLVGSSLAQIEPTPEQMKFYTPEWQGERDKGGRPLVSGELMDRLINISIEEAWGVLRGEGYRNQFESGWEMLHPEKPFVGRALTVQYMPERPDLNNQIKKVGKQEGRIGASNSWPIDMLKERDVYVADGMGKVLDGTLIGDNLGNSIYSKSKTGVVFDGGVRDYEGLSQIEGFNAFVRGFDPSYITDMMVTGINVPVRIGKAIVSPGDVVLAKHEGVIFIPAHLVEKVVITGEFIALRDKFGHEMLKKGVYTPGQIDTRWTDEIKNAFLKWLDNNPDQIPMSREELDEYMKNRTW
jgi:4-hydroxy-4-methyl-2-oxoglutarate aldolase